MWEQFLAKFDGGELIGLTSVVGGLLTAVLIVMAVQWRRVRVAEIEAHLVQQMLERGMTADEIAQVLRPGRTIRARALAEAVQQRCAAHRH